MIDLRSDILGGWSSDVLKAMTDAASDPPGFSHGEDFHQRALEEEISELFGFESSLFVPTGTLANQIAVRLWCQPGQIIIADRESHIVTNEAASTAALNGVVVHGVEGKYGHLSREIVESTLSTTPRSSLDRQVALVWLENTHNQAGGTVSPEGWIQDVGECCLQRRKAVHIDGARIWNAAVATGINPSLLVAGANSLSVNLNKAVGAPAGAMILGDREFIKEAARVRRMMGGMWRPVGMLAAGARTAIQGYQERLGNDHVRAYRFAESLAHFVNAIGSVNAPQTNIVVLTCLSEAYASTLLTEMKQRRILATSKGGGRIRFVLHAGITDSDVATAVDAVRNAIQAMGRAI